MVNIFKRLAAVMAFSIAVCAVPQKAQAINNTVVFPYVVSGGTPQGWNVRTLLIVKNPRKVSNAGSIELFDNTGEQWPVLQVGESELKPNAKWMTLPEDSTMVVVADPSEDLQTGWVKVTPYEKSPIELLAVIQLYQGDELVKESVISEAPTEGDFWPFTMVSFKQLHGWRVLQSGDPQGRVYYSLPGASNEPEGHVHAVDRRWLIQMIPAARSFDLLKRNQPKHRVLYTEAGRASWYGNPFHGRVAANGTVYDMNKLTAAHPTLAFGTRAKITNLRNGRSVWVHITDRGPFIRGRIVDLSIAAANQIGLLASGIAPVRLEVVSSR